MDEALALVADAVKGGRALRLDSTLSVTLQRAVGDNQITFSVQVPPAGVVESAQPASGGLQPPIGRRPSVQFGQARVAGTDSTAVQFGPARVAGTESGELRPRATAPISLGARTNTELDALAIGGIGGRQHSESEFGGAADEVNRLMNEIERLKRKALSRGVNLTSQHEDVPAEDVARLRAVFAMADSTGTGYINVNELQALHHHLGEPLTDDEAQDAFRRIDVNHTGDIS